MAGIGNPGQRSRDGTGQCVVPRYPPTKMAMADQCRWRIVQAPGLCLFNAVSKACTSAGSSSRDMPRLSVGGKAIGP